MYINVFGSQSLWPVVEGGVRARLTARLIAHALRGQSGRADFTEQKQWARARVHEKILTKNTHRRTRSCGPGVVVIVVVGGSPRAFEHPAFVVIWFFSPYVCVCLSRSKRRKISPHNTDKWRVVPRRHSRDDRDLPAQDFGPFTRRDFVENRLCRRVSRGLFNNNTFSA